MAGLAFDILARDKASPAFDKVSKSVERTEKKFGFLAARTGGLTAGMTAGFGKIAGAMVAVASVQVFKGFIDEARESRKVGALTESIIKSTGGAAKISAKQVGELATSISNKTGVDDEAIQSGSNLLLTFKNVRNEVGKGAQIFDRATAAAVDLSAAGFGDVNSASKMLGKALNDPLKGISALGKAGVTFTEDQKKQIATLVETGKTLEAQKIILQEVESQVGGAAAAAADPMAKLGVIIGNTKEAIGTAFLPMIDKAATFLGDKIPSAIGKASTGFSALKAAFQEGDVTSDGFVGVMERIGVTARRVFDVFQTVALPRLREFGGFVSDKLIPSLGDFLGFITKWPAKVITGLKTGFDTGDWGPLGKSIGEGLISALKGLGELGGRVLDGVGALLDKVDWGKLGTKISNGLLGMIRSVDWKGVGDALGDAAISGLQKATTLGQKMGNAFRDLMNKVDWNKVGRDSTDAIGRFISGIDWGRLAKTLGVALLKSLKVNVSIKNVIINSLSDLVSGMAQSIHIFVDREFTKSGNWLNHHGKNLVAGFKNGISSIAASIGGWIRSKVISPVTGAFSKAGSWLVQQGRNLVAGLQNGVVSIARGIGGWVNRTVISPTVGAFGRAGTWLVQQGRNLVAGFKNGAFGVARTIGSWAYTNVIVPAVKPFGSAITWLGRAGRDLIGGLTGGIATRMKGIGGWIKSNVVDPMVSAVKKFFGIKSPSTVFAGIGGHLVGGLLKGMGSGMGSAVAKKVFGDMPSALRSIVGKGLISVAGLPQKAMDALGTAVGFGDPLGGKPAPTSTGGNVGIVRTLAAHRGWGSGAQWNALYNLIMGESGFRNTAQNPTSTAYGMFQFLNSTWGSVGASKTSDPWGQTVAGLKYIAGSYGSPLNAYAKWSSRSPHWYEQGTPWVPNDQLAFLHKGEGVIPRQVNEARMRAGGGTQTVVLEFRSDGSPHMDWLIREFRKYVKINGGNVQQALGPSR
jgi:acid phosphatase family membrane protein YuiD